MYSVVAVNFVDGQKQYLFDVPYDLDLPLGSQVYVKTRKGPQIVKTSTPVMHFDTEEEYRALLKSYGANICYMKPVLGQVLTVIVPLEPKALAFWSHTLAMRDALFPPVDDEEQEQADGA